MARKGKGPEEGIARRELRLLEELFRRQSVDIEDLVTMYRGEFHILDRRTLLDDVNGTKTRQGLRERGFPIEVTGTEMRISPIGLEGLWKGTPIGDRLSRGKESKKLLAKEVVRYLLKLNEDLKQDIKRIVLGTGTTVYEAAKEILNHNDELNIRNVHTSNLLVLREFILRKPRNIKIEMSPGTLVRETASLATEEDVERPLPSGVDAVVTSFNGLSYEKGFSTGVANDVREKFSNLCPRKECKWVIIPIEWQKVGFTDVAVVGKRKKRRDVLDFVQGTRTYVIITDPPKGTPAGKDQGRFKGLEKWNALDGVEVVYAKEQQENKEEMA